MSNGDREREYTLKRGGRYMYYPNIIISYFNIIKNMYNINKFYIMKLKKYIYIFFINFNNKC
jgi:hypothetical protein